MCRTCRSIVPARVAFQEDGVWQQSLCPTCSNEKALIAADKEWYLRHVPAEFPDRSPLTGAHPPKNGCPHDCGPCTWHASPCQLPVISITNACDLTCPVCFTYNRPDRRYFMPAEELSGIVDWIIASSGPVDLINITGGEPTLHPELVDLLKLCKRPEIGRVTMNTNGLRLAEDESLCRQLADLEICVVLSFNTLDPDVSIRMQGRDVVEAKQRAIENLTRAGARMTLLHVMKRGTNEATAAAILDLMRTHENILSYTVQTMTYTGQGGGQLPERHRIPVDEAAGIVADHSRGELAFTDFLARPSAHPLCYLTCFFLKVGDRFLPFTRLASPERIRSLMKDSYLIRLEDDPAFFRDAINDLFATNDQEALLLLRNLVGTLYPNDRALDAFTRQRLAEASVRTVYVHAHMDEETFDAARAMLCPDLVPVEPGRLIPACTYNLFYRMKDERFYARG
jgi:hypothetical protein